MVGWKRGVISGLRPFMADKKAALWGCK